jgi:GMP synthase-like glutamine amidotransferase
VSGSPRLLVVVPSETDQPARLGEWLTEAGLELDARHLGLGEELPGDLAGHDGLLVLGGPQSAVEGFPELDPVRDLLRLAVDDDVPTLAVCLGGQLLAQAGGGAVRAAAEGPEVGVGLVAKRDRAGSDPLFGPLPLSPDVVQWHHDEISLLPGGATLLASNPRYENQAFRVGAAVYGLQFHIETTPQIIRDWAESDPIGVASTPFDAATLVARAEAVDADLVEIWQPFADRFAELVRGRARRAA